MKRIDNILLRLLYAYVLFSLCNLIYLHKLVTRTGRDERHWLAFTHQHDKTKSLDEAQSGDKITDSTVNVNFPSKSGSSRVNGVNGVKPTTMSEEKQSLTPSTPLVADRVDTRSEDNNDSKKYNATLYQIQVDQTLDPIKNTGTSTVWIFQRFWAGFCNQYMMFIGVIYITQEGHHNQIIEDSMQWKDTYGTEHYIPHYKLFDVVHWNSFYPALPRFDRYERDVHRDIKLNVPEVEIAGKQYAKGAWVSPNVTGGHPFEVSENPKPIIYRPREMRNRYKDVMRKVTNNIREGEKSAFELDAIHRLIMKGALRPHPEIQGIMDLYMNGMRDGVRGDGGGGAAERFMVLHARVEFDMGMHPMCKDKKVTNMTEIVSMIYEKYPEPPVSTVLIIFNRELMESTQQNAPEGIKNNRDAKKAYADASVRNLTEHNLKVINDMVQNGLWNGTVRVKEAGSKMVKDVAKNPYYAYYSTIVGMIVNFFLAIQSDIFIGSEVSSYSSLVVNSRFYREERENYFYRPQGLFWVTPSNATTPYRFIC